MLNRIILSEIQDLYEEFGELLSTTLSKEECQKTVTNLWKQVHSKLLQKNDDFAGFTEQEWEFTRFLSKSSMELLIEAQKFNSLISNLPKELDLIV